MCNLSDEKLLITIFARLECIAVLVVRRSFSKNANNCSLFIYWLNFLLVYIHLRSLGCFDGKLRWVVRSCCQTVEHLGKKNSRKAKNWHKTMSKDRKFIKSTISSFFSTSLLLADYKTICFHPFLYQIHHSPSITCNFKICLAVFRFLCIR